MRQLVAEPKTDKNATTRRNDAKFVHPRAEDCAARLCSPVCAIDRWSPRPIRSRPSARSNCASRAAACAGRRRPLQIASSQITVSMQADPTLRDHAQMFSAYLPDAMERQFAGRSEQSNRWPNFPCWNVLMLKPRVGLTLMMSSPLIFFRIVVFPALSSPLWSIDLHSE
jgi:hypothetical protein